MTQGIKTLLVVEDEEDVLELLLAVFEDFTNYRVLSASDGSEALALAREVNPDIIVLDIQLPGLNGYEVCKAIKSDQNMRTAKVLVISGMAQYSDRQIGQEAGADLYITKPFSIDELLEAVQGLMRSN